jgi:hypothetical protein
MIRYTYELDPDHPASFDIDEEGDSSDEAGIESIPAWMELENHRCDHCTLPAGSRRSCPAALAIQPVLEVFSDKVSHDTVQVTVDIRDARLQATTTVEKAARSLAGLLMALSSCPVMRQLRPMARFHLPFGGREHTAFRFMGSYLLAQFLRNENGLQPDWSMRGLVDMLHEIHRTNKQIAERIREATAKDALANSLANLDSIAMLVEVELETGLGHMKPPFSRFLEK